MSQLILMIIQTGLTILQQQQAGGSVSTNAVAILEIVSLAKAAYEKETGQPLDVDKIRPYIPI